MLKIIIDIYNILGRGGNKNGTTKKKMVKSKNTLKKINMEKRRKLIKTCY